MESVNYRTIQQLLERFPQLQTASEPEEASAAQSMIFKTQLHGATLDNRKVTQGMLFIALPGLQTHGAKFAADAVARGAAAVLTDAAGAKLLAGSSEQAAPDMRVPVLVSPTLVADHGPVAHWIAGDPIGELQAFGITGTNGKTTTTYLITQLQELRGQQTGLIGTIETRVGQSVVDAVLTTPPATEIADLFASMVQAGVHSLAMEVSSHALVQGRVGGAHFDVVGFTNLSQDHLDLHRSMDEYFAAKAQLFSARYAERGVVVLQDNWSQKLLLQAQVPVTTVGLDSDLNPDFLVQPTGHAGDFYLLRQVDGQRLHVPNELLGAYNQLNAALATVMVLESGVTLHEMAHTFQAGGFTASVPGRMETLAGKPRTLVDFAHNTEAMELAFAAVNTEPERLTALFGATGDRDKTKRKPMVHSALRHAGRVVLTDDDPHGEDPGSMRAEMFAYAQAAGGADQVTVVAPRALAIRHAIVSTQPEDTVLLLGRGHEKIQEIAGVDHWVDDRYEAAVALRLVAGGQELYRDLERYQGAELHEVDLSGVGTSSSSSPTSSTAPDEAAAAHTLIVPRDQLDPLRTVDTQVVSDQIRALLQERDPRDIVAVIGELDGASHRDYDDLATSMVRWNLGRVLVVGAAARPLYLNAIRQGSWDNETIFCADQDAATAWLSQNMPANACIFVQGSYSSQVRRIADHLMTLQQGAGQ